MEGPGGQAKKYQVEGISVFVRVRPATVDEASDGETQLVVEPDVDASCVSVRNGGRPNRSVQCTFDKVFGRDCTQKDVFDGLVPALDTVLQGFNACVLAYGQTGSGKTHTLIGPGGGTRLPDDLDDWGVIPRAVQFLFDRLTTASEEDETFAYSVTCSFLQIYNETLVDLLQDGGRCAGSSLQIREESSGQGNGQRSSKRRGRRSRQETDDGVDFYRRQRTDYRGRVMPSALHENRRVFVNGLSSFRVGGAQDVLRYINIGAANRRVRATQHNEDSSRSHAVMQLVVEAESGGGRDGTDEGLDSAIGSEHVKYRQAKLSLVDLAGSEKMDSTLNISKGHFKELRSINQSLSALGNVISALTEKGRTHVPYRDSKLTRLLQDSLGGNTRTTIIACVSPLAAQTHETVSTLQFADRAKKVMVRLRPNEVVDDRILLARAQAEIVRLKQLLRQALDAQLGDFAGADGIQPNVQNGQVLLRADSSPRSSGSDRVAETGKMVKKARCTEDIVSLSTDATPTRDATVSATATNERQTARLVHENERLRDDNERLKLDLQQLIAREQDRQKQKRRHRQRKSPLTPSTTNGRPFQPPPVDWGARYADAADTARRKRTPCSRSRPLFVDRNGRPSSSIRSSSPAVSPARMSAATLQIPQFCRREFDDDSSGISARHDYARDCGGTPNLSIEPLQHALGNKEEESGAVISSASENDEEEKREALAAARQLDEFRSALDGRALGDGGVKRSDNRKLVDVEPEVAGERKGQAVGQYEFGSTDFGEFQRLEDLMFEAQGRERQRAKEERARLAATRAERLTLEAELASLLSSPATPDAEVHGIPANMAPSTTNVYSVRSFTAKKGSKEDETTSTSQKIINVAALPLPDGLIAPFADIALPNKKAVDRSEKFDNLNVEDNLEGCVKGERSADEAPAVSGHRDITMTSANETCPSSDPVGDSNVYLAIDVSQRPIAPPPQCPVARQTGWTTPPPRPRRSPTRRRPATSGGIAAGRARPWRNQGGGGNGADTEGANQSRSPARVQCGVAVPHTPRQRERQNHRDRRRQNQGGRTASAERRNNHLVKSSMFASTATLSSSEKAKLMALRRSYPAFSSPGRAGPVGQRRGNSRMTTWGDASKLDSSAVQENAEGTRRRRNNNDNDADVGIGDNLAAARAKLAYGVADLGLRLTVYSFRYDHYYECQVIGYDARRRMHRCSYDATGEKQWHDLRSKRFEVVGHNGVVTRTAESAPQPFISMPLLPQASAVR